MTTLQAPGPRLPALDERYVREWLAAMTTGRIVGHDGATGTFSLPADHAAWWDRAVGDLKLPAGTPAGAPE